MRPSARLWLEERRRCMNALPAEEEQRLRRMKERLGIAGTENSAEEQSGSHSSRAAQLLCQNAALASRVAELERLCHCHEEKEELLRGELHNALDESRRVSMQLILLTQDRRMTELLMEEELRREQLVSGERRVRGDMALASRSLARVMVPSPQPLGHSQRRVLKASSLKPFYA